MNAPAVRFLLAIIIISGGCASIQPPPGGKRDVTPPKLLSATPPDSELNVRLNKIELRFDEYLTLTDATKEVQISPILSIQPTTLLNNKKVTIKIADSLLEDNTTYRVSFGSAIKDLHEGNVFKKYTYTFSTGSYFDSLVLTGKVINAATGLPDSGANVVLYSATVSDSAVVRQKPKYITFAGADGNFTIKGLPDRKFRIYALTDLNSNLIYDGGEERIGFYDRIIRPGDSIKTFIILRTFKEIDTSRSALTDSAKLSKRKADKAGIASAKDGFTYAVAIDTSNTRTRTVEITQPVSILFNKEIASVADNRITLSYDSSGVSLPAPFSISKDTSKKFRLLIYTNWLENTVYTLKLLKGFAKDTGNANANPSKYMFRTKRDEDYGILHLHIPSRYFGRKFLLMVQNDKDTIYTKPVLDSTIDLVHLKPGIYSFRIISDKNENGKWDPGNLFEKIQPEEVIPYDQVITLKAGWENIIDFEQKTQPAPKNPDNPKSAKDAKPK